MTTKLIGIKEFRQNISSYAKKAQKGNVRYVVSSRNKPIFEIRPFDEDESIESLLNIQEIMRAEKEIENGEFYTQEEVLAELAKNNKK